MDKTQGFLVGASDSNISYVSESKNKKQFDVIITEKTADEGWEAVCQELEIVEVADNLESLYRNVEISATEALKEKKYYFVEDFFLNFKFIKKLNLHGSHHIPYASLIGDGPSFSRHSVVLSRASRNEILEKLKSYHNNHNFMFHHGLVTKRDDSFVWTTAMLPNTSKNMLVVIPIQSNKDVVNEKLFHFGSDIDRTYVLEYLNASSIDESNDAKNATQESRSIREQIDHLASLAEEESYTIPEGLSREQRRLWIKMKLKEST